MEYSRGTLRNPRLLPMESLQRFTHRFGTLLSRCLLTVLYFVLLGPFALLYRLGTDPLRRRRPRPGAGNWSTWTGTNDTLSAARRQD